MGIMVTKKDDNEELTDKISADLRNKDASSLPDEEEDFVETSEYLKETERTGRFAWVWVVLIVLAIISIIFMTLL